MKKLALVALALALALAGCSSSPAPASPYHPDNLEGQPQVVQDFMACQWSALQESPEGVTMAALHEACNFDGLAPVEQDQVRNYEFSYLK